MRVALSVLGKFHTFDLARELQARGALACIFTGYPMYKLKQEKLPLEKIRSFPWINTPYMAMTQRARLGEPLLRFWERQNCEIFDSHTAKHLPPCDVFVGLSSSSLLSGKRAKQLGSKFVCDRGSTHIREQDDLLRDEHALWGMRYMRTDPRIVEREEAEYEAADAITVPSSFSVRSFVTQGVPPQKIRQLGYGVNLDAFYADGQTVPKDSFDILFVGGADLRKGIPYLLQAFNELKHPRKTLTFAGSVSASLIGRMRSAGLWNDNIKLLGHLHWNQLRDEMNRSHVLVLPSIEDGFGLVIAQAMACGCPVIASENTGAPDLFQDGEAGFIVPIRRADVLAERLQQLADQPELRNKQSQAALGVVRHIGGWRTYGDNAMRIYESLLS